MNRNKSLLMVALFASSAGIAAQVEETVPAAPVVSAPAPAAQAYPMIGWDRPSILPVGMIETLVGVTSDGTENHKLGINASVTTGITNLMQARLKWGGASVSNFAFGDTQVDKTLELKVSHKLFSTSFMGMKGHLSLPFHIADGEVLRDMSIATQASIVLADRLLLRTMHRNTAKITFRPEAKVSTAVPVNIGAQVTDRLWLEADATLATLNWGTDYKGIWNETPISVGATWAFNNQVDLDLSVGFDDAQKPKDTLTGALSVIYRPFV